jgi:hypothetical protein
MSFATRITLILALVLILPATVAFTQEAPAAEEVSGEAEILVEAAAAAETSETRPGSSEIRNMFRSLLRRHPAELAMVLKLEPALVSNQQFVSGYPELQRFLAEYPEIRDNPRFYLAGFRTPSTGGGSVEEIFEPVAIFSVFALIAFALAWLVRTIIEQKRWNRLSRTQSEVHNKILDRFGTSAELLEYIRSPAGTNFLESAPIPLHTEQAAQNAPLTRILWSVQIGVVVAVAGLGMLLLGAFSGESALGFLTLGLIAFSVGVGFVASAGISIYLSRRLGLWQESGPAGESGIDDPGIVR